MKFGFKRKGYKDSKKESAVSFMCEFKSHNKNRNMLTKGSNKHFRLFLTKKEFDTIELFLNYLKANSLKMIDSDSIELHLDPNVIDVD